MNNLTTSFFALARTEASAKKIVKTLNDSLSRFHTYPVKAFSVDNAEEGRWTSIIMHSVGAVSDEMIEKFHNIIMGMDAVLTGNPLSLM